MPEAVETPRVNWSDAAPIFKRIAGRALIYEVGWKVVTLFLLGPLVTALLNAAIALGWNSAVTNGSLLHFGLSPLGLATLVAFGCLSLAIQFFEQAGLVILAISAARGGRVSLREMIWLATKNLPRLATIALLQIVIAAVCIAPFLALVGLTYSLLLSGSDINFFLATRPPRFLAAVGIAALLASGAVAVLLGLYLRWIFAVPASLFDGHSPRSALLASASMVKGRARRVFGAVVVWQVAKFVGFAALVYVLDFAGGSIIDAVGTHVPRGVVLGTVAFLMVANGGVLALASIAESIGFGLLVALLYETARRESGGLPILPEPERVAGPVAVLTRKKRVLRVLGVLIAVALFTAGEAWLVVRKFTERRPVGVTAHRAGPRPAPENTLAALRSGIATGAEFAEIDVQKTLDGKVVVLHDKDLLRLAGVARTIRSMTFEEVRAIDVGVPAGPEFRGEKIATLDEFIDAARGRIKLNIEMKYYGHDPTLAPDVVALLHKHHFARQVVVCSLDPVGLAEVRGIDPTIKVGYIVSAAIGDMTRLDVDVLSLNHSVATPALVGLAHRRGLQVHAWDVDDPTLAVELIDRGIDNLISDDPAMALRVVAWYNGLSDIELILLRFRDWLGSSTFRRFVEREHGEPSPGSADGP